MDVGEFNTFLTQLKKSLQKLLPGSAAQYKMAPEGRQDRMVENLHKKVPRPGSVLILLYPDAGELWLPFTLRHTYKGVHSGQVSFPGGKQDPEDESPLQTALREAHEEIGVLPQQVKILGQLTELYIPPSNFLVTPFVGFSEARPEFRPQEVEVKELIPFPLRQLQHKEATGVTKITTSYQQELLSPYYNINGHKVWGATAMILAEFLEVLEDL